MAKRVITLYAAETVNEEGKECGKETIRRIMACLKYVDSHPGDEYHIILGAGIRPDKPEYVQLKRLMKDYLLKKNPSLEVILAEQDGWGTLLESNAILGELPRETNEFLICSSWYHIPRIKLVWWLIAPQIRTKTIIAPSPKLWSIGIEMLSFAKLVFDFFIKK